MKTVTIKRERVTKDTVESEVVLPDYHQHDMMEDDYDCVIYTRVAEDQSGVDLHVTTYPDWYGLDTSARYEIEINRHETPFFDDDKHMAGVKRCSREDFLNAAREMKAVIDKLIADVEAEDSSC